MSKGKTLLDILEEAYKKHGYYKEKQISLVLEGVEGKSRIQRMMDSYRKSYPKKIGEMTLAKAIDYLEGYEDIPSSDVLKFYLDDGSWYAVRPSGTEPKIKIYLYTKADTSTQSDKNLQIMENTIMTNLNSID
jgi:phosphoglucomutase